MRLTDEQVIRLQKLYLEVLGEHISKEEAQKQGLALARFVKALAAKNMSKNTDGREQTLYK